MKQLLFVAIAAAFGSSMTAQDAAPIMLAPADIKWVDGPPSLPPGSKMAVIQGDPKMAGPFTLRAKLPADYKVPPHFHPDTETVTVLSGTFNVAMGDSFDASKTKAMPAGSFIALPGKNAHFVFTKEETIIQVNATGPWTLTYVNPADDPRNKK